MPVTWLQSVSSEGGQGKMREKKGGWGRTTDRLLSPESVGGEAGGRWDHLLQCSERPGDGGGSPKLCSTPSACVTRSVAGGGAEGASQHREPPRMPPGNTRQSMKLQDWKV